MLVVVKTDDCAVVCGAKAGATDVLVTVCAMNGVSVDTDGNCWSRVVRGCCCCVDVAMCDRTTQVLIWLDGPSVITCLGTIEDIVML